MATVHSKTSLSLYYLCMALLLFCLKTTEAVIGVCYGWDGNNLPSRQQVVNIYKANGIDRMRIYYPDHDVLQAVQGSSIKVLLDVPNDQVQNFAQNPSLAVQWVQQNVAPYASAINYLAVGNEVAQEIKQYVGPALQNTLNALRSTNSLADRIKVTTAIGMDQIKNSYPPSAGEFNDLPFMDPIVNFLKQNGSPLLLNVYPYLTYIAHKDTVREDYALFTSPGTVVRDPNGLEYQNLYDAQKDSVNAALAKRGAPNVPVITTETAWKGAGGPDATRQNAGTYYRNVANHARAGTPRKPGPSDVYLFSMFDENQKSADEQNYGIFDPNGQSRYNINFRA